MTEYKYVDLPHKKVENGGTIRADAISKDLNDFAAAGWAVINSLPSPLIGKIGFTLQRG